MTRDAFKIKVLCPDGWMTRWSGNIEASARREFGRWKERGATVRLVKKTELDRHQGHVHEPKGVRVDWPGLCHELADLVTDMLCHFDDVPADMHERARLLVEKAQDGIDTRPVREFAQDGPA